MEHVPYDMDLRLESWSKAAFTMGTMRATAAKLLIHMDKKAVVNMNPINNLEKMIVNTEKLSIDFTGSVMFH